MGLTKGVYYIVMNLNPSAGTPDTSLMRSPYNDDYPTVHRCMAFVDITSFTDYTHANGNHAAAAKVAAFRVIVRATTGRHRVRVARWIGDGVMLVGLHTQPVVETLLDIAAQCREIDITVHCGAATGEVIIFEGDDYIGRTVNVASRLSQLAGEFELYGHNLNTSGFSSNYHWEPLEELSVRGVGTVHDVIRLQLP